MQTMIEMSAEKEALGEDLLAPLIEVAAEGEGGGGGGGGGGGHGASVPPPEEPEPLGQDGEEKSESENTVAELPGPRNGMQPPCHQQQQSRVHKRRSSFNVGFKHPAFKRRRRVNSDCDPVLPSNFLLGGNIFDPLNLNSLLDEEVNRALNAETPKSSPLPAKNRDPVEILIPKDITDPLSLNSGNDAEVLVSPIKSGRKRHRHRGPGGGGGAAANNNNNKPQVCNAAECPPPPPPPQQPPPRESFPAEEAPLPPPPAEGPLPYELNTATNCRDETVSPNLPPGHGGSRHRKRKRTCSRSEPGQQRGGENESEPRKISPEKPRSRSSCCHHHPAAPPPPPPPHPRPGFPSKRQKYQYGNYCKYYGYRNPGRGDDHRLRVLKPEWFEGRSVLDLGCNVGHITLAVARSFKPRRIVGLDLDGGLIYAARQNVRHYLSEQLQRPPGQQGAPTRQFPLSMTINRGPLAAPQVPLQSSASEFPNNVTFVKGNYVLERDELLDTQKPEYDAILCLSMTKWVHLNWGDEGLKRMFKRIYRHLHPGGILVLEPQPWSSYSKRKKLTETIYKNYYRIHFKPEQFTSYLVSPEVGFSSYELVGIPQNTAKGFQRPIYLFHKDR
ncbi:7SK snRNA methylphosphate capping enzyme [Latimeria chalumnae]|uniref:7SK snRNA methylphosphate capping enzyme n=1 Tax=Latimeria chalumnae TaxID=7897 RepID=UPI00313C5047